MVTQRGRTGTRFSYAVFHAFSKPPIIDRPAELERRLPRRSSIIHKFAYWVRAVL